jgi:dimeric dUTPase (all-alpha-NTP-PPase superfamily)
MRRSPVVILSLVIAASVHVQAQGEQSCTKEDAIRAETESSSLQNWSAVYNSYKNFVHCDDASIAEGYSNSIAHLLSEDWDTIDQLNKLVSRNKNFEQFVLRHIDELMSPAQAEKIRENSVLHCTRRASRLCKSISIRLEQTRPSQEPHR